MTLVEQRPSTATGPTVWSTARQLRGPGLVLLALVLAGTLLGVLSATGPSGRLDPDSYAPAGSRAVAELLRDGGVPVRRLDTVDAVVAASGPDLTLVIPVPGALAETELKQLAELDAALVVIGAQDEQLAALDLPARTGGPVEVDRRQPACDLEPANRAGEVDLGGETYRPQGGSMATGCYAASGNATLLRLPDRDATLLGDGGLLTNDRLDERGNAALALALLGQRDGGVLWLVPLPGRQIAGGPQTSLSDLLPDGLLLGAVQMLVAVGVLALWRARRLGRVVEEPLPVVVRAAEAVEGRSRLYRAARARGQAGEALRVATRERLSRRVGLAVSTDRRELGPVVAERTGIDPNAVDALLYGGGPTDDAALVRLVTDLRRLEAALTMTSNGKLPRGKGTGS
ncbi:MAG: DUF4350 domain-containing protein [Mycobacteriales bacterium]